LFEEQAARINKEKESGSVVYARRDGERSRLAIWYGIQAGDRQAGGQARCMRQAAGARCAAAVESVR